MIAGVDAGNYEIKVFSELGATRLLSNLGEFRERKLTQTFSDDDIVFEYLGRKGFAGTLAKYESEFNGSIMGDSKVHPDTVIRVLLGLCKHSPVDGSFHIVVTQPIVTHDDAHKTEMKRMLRGEHQIIINDRARFIEIAGVEVAAEGGAAFWSAPTKGLIRIADFGSGTVNAATLIDGRYIDKDSFTEPFGMETNKSQDISELVRAFAAKASKKWRFDDPVQVAGAAAKVLLPHMRSYFPRAEVLHPKIMRNGEEFLLKPVMANAVGLYQIAKGVFR